MTTNISWRGYQITREQLFPSGAYRLVTRLNNGELLRIAFYGSNASSALKTFKERIKEMETDRASLQVS